MERNQRNQEKARQHSSHTKTKPNLALPKIYRTTVTSNYSKLNLNNKQNSHTHYPLSNQSHFQLSFAKKVNWVTQQTDYSAWNENQIHNEYEKLKNQLQSINEQAIKAVQRIDIKSMKKSKISEPDCTRVLQVKVKQVQNNNAIKDRLEKQYQQLQKRLSSISNCQKENLDDVIEQSKQKLNQTRTKIKDFKLQNKNMGNSIADNDQFHQQIRRVEAQKESQQRKKIKLQSKIDSILDQIANIQLKSQEINDDYEIADNYFEEYHNYQQQTEQQKALQKKLLHAKHYLEVNKKKCEITNNTKQQKYHHLLKGFEAQATKITSTESRTAQAQINIINNKKKIQQFEQLLVRLQSQMPMKLIEEPIFFTEFEEKVVQKDRNQQVYPRNSDKKIENQQTQGNKIDNCQQNNQKVRNGRERVNTLQIGELQEEQKDAITEMVLDQKSKYGTKKSSTKRKFGFAHRNSKENSLETENQSLDTINDDDDQIVEFKNKISAHRKSGEIFHIDSQLEQIQQNLQSVEGFKKNENKQSFMEDQVKSNHSS